MDEMKEKTLESQICILLKQIKERHHLSRVFSFHITWCRNALAEFFRLMNWSCYMLVHLYSEYLLVLSTFNYTCMLVFLFYTHMKTSVTRYLWSFHKCICYEVEVLVYCCVWYMIWYIEVSIGVAAISFNDCDAKLVSSLNGMFAHY